jgi:hypothetical protein
MKLFAEPNPPRHEWYHRDDREKMEYSFNAEDAMKPSVVDGDEPRLGQMSKTALML